MKNNSIGKRIKHREDMFLRQLFGLLARMAKIDGKVDTWEAHAAEGAFARFLRAMARRKFCVAVFNSAKNGRTPLGRLAAEFELEKASTGRKHIGSARSRNSLTRSRSLPRNFYRKIYA